MNHGRDFFLDCTWPKLSCLGDPSFRFGMDRVHIHDGMKIPGYLRSSRTFNGLQDKKPCGGPKNDKVSVVAGHGRGFL
jgi:hypothetical protein